MRIVFVVNNYPPRVGGVENHVAALARQLAAQGHVVIVHTLSDVPSGPVDEGGVRVTRWRELFQIGGLLGFPTPEALRGMARAIVRDGPDILSVHTRFFPLTWLGAALGRRHRIPVLHTEHGSGHVATSSPVIRWGSRVVDWTLGRWSLRSATRVVGVSEEVVAFVRRLSGVDATVFHNAIEPPAVACQTPIRRHAVFVGRIVPGKGWEDFLAALAAQDSDVTADVLGTGSDLAKVQRQAERLGWGDRLVVRGRVPLAQVYASLAGSVLVNPTRLSEGFQTTLLEALAVGARVVTYPAPGAGILVAQGAPIRVVTADVVALGDALAQAMDDSPSPWPAERIRAWTWPQRAEEYVTLARETMRMA